MIDRQLLKKWYTPTISTDVQQHAENIWGFLSTHDRIPSSAENDVLAVAGNWYDGVKALRLVKLASDNFPKARIFLAGGIGRLTSRRAAGMGGEPIEMIQVHYKNAIRRLGKDTNIHSDLIARTHFYTGARHTGDNIDAFLYWKNRQFGEKPVNVIFIDESYLLARVRANLLSQLSKRGDGRTKVSFLSTDTSSYYELTEKLHKKRSLVTLHLIAGEAQRLFDYTEEGSQTHYFPRSLAFEHATMYGGEEGILRSLETIKHAHDFEEGVKIMGDRELALRLFEPKCRY